MMSSDKKSGAFRRVLYREIWAKIRFMEKNEKNRLLLVIKRIIATLSNKDFNAQYHLHQL